MANLANVCYAPGHAHWKYLLIWGENQLVHPMSNRYCTSVENHHREQELVVEAYAQGEHLLVEDYAGSVHIYLLLHQLCFCGQSVYHL